MNFEASRQTPSFPEILQPVSGFRSKIFGLALGITSMLGCSPIEQSKHPTPVVDVDPATAPTGEDPGVFQKCSFYDPEHAYKSELPERSLYEIALLDRLNDSGIAITMKDGEPVLDIGDFDLFDGQDKRQQALLTGDFPPASGQPASLPQLSLKGFRLHEVIRDYVGNIYQDDPALRRSLHGITLRLLETETASQRDVYLRSKDAALQEARLKALKLYYVYAEKTTRPSDQQIQEFLMPDINLHRFKSVLAHAGATVYINENLACENEKPTWQANHCQPQSFTVLHSSRSYLHTSDPLAMTRVPEDYPVDSKSDNELYLSPSSKISQIDSVYSYEDSCMTTMIKTHGWAGQRGVLSATEFSKLADQTKYRIRAFLAQLGMIKNDDGSYAWKNELLTW